MHSKINSILLIIISVLLIRSVVINYSYDNPYITQAMTRYSDLQKNAPETLRTPVSDEFMSQACYDRARVLFAEHGDWATQGNYGEMELCN
jgi:hypothetical protein